ncbi:hypothetical protein NPIL_164821 [Nephila pilipes]|uniref:Uncharacterized protein n=1 Tax=Nephila pilipes TaxID=299642 RepID=A0A8X6QFJ4_NEPPI|nr:hypothetical protein NPIL_164821 [Nephila pilipes]
MVGNPNQSNGPIRSYFCSSPYKSRFRHKLSREGIWGLPLSNLERLWHHETVFPAPESLERTKSIPGLVDFLCSNGEGFRLRKRVASLRLPSGRTLYNLPANDAKDENSSVWIYLSLGLLIQTRYTELHLSFVQVPQTSGV